VSHSTYEVIYTMSRAATDDEWQKASLLANTWLSRCAKEHRDLFADAIIRVDENALHVELAGSEDLIIERAGTVDIWSARTASLEATRVLAGVLLCVQYALTADAIQLSGSKAGAWQSAAGALTSVWGGDHVARVIFPRRHKADALVYVDAGSNAQIMRDYFRTHLELSADVLPDHDFKDTPAAA
jgi:hypothetical protein